MSRLEKSIETMAEEIRMGNYTNFGKLLELCAYIPKEVLETAAKLGYEKEDILQESAIAFLHALRSFDKSKGAGFRTYASACIKNHIASLLRGQSKNKAPMTDYISIEDVDLVSENEPENGWIEKEALFEMKKKLSENLSDFEFEVLRLYLEGFSYKIIGEKLQKTEKSVSNALSRVRKKLREVFPE